MDKNSADAEELHPAFLGIPTFMRCPVTRDVGKADVVVMGIPFDGDATSFRNGASFGPRKIREASWIQIGIRGPGTHPQEINGAKELGAEVLEIDECFEIRAFYHRYYIP